MKSMGFMGPIQPGHSQSQGAGDPFCMVPIQVPISLGLKGAETQDPVEDPPLHIPRPSDCVHAFARH